MYAPIEEALDVFGGGTYCSEEAPASEEDLATPVEVAPVVEKDAAPVSEPADSQSEEAEEVVSRRWCQRVVVGGGQRRWHRWLRGRSLSFGASSHSSRRPRRWTQKIEEISSGSLSKGAWFS